LADTEERENDMDSKLNSINEWLDLPEAYFYNIKAENPEDFFESNQSLFSIIESIPNGVTILSPNFKVLYINQRMRGWFAKGRKNYKIKCYRLFHDRKSPCENCPALIAAKTKVSSSVIHMCGANDNTGEAPYMQHIDVIPITNNKGDVICFVEYSYNLTEQRRSVEKIRELKSRCYLLEQENSLLKKSLDEERQRNEDMETSIQDTFNNYVHPALDFLKKRLSTDEQNAVSDLIEEASYPITHKRNTVSFAFSPREWQVVLMIKKGYSSKQIADNLCLSKKAIDYHRANIRKKLKLKQGTNLELYLQAHI
jgi:DNA-binding CsgD family transcriptional regulator